MHLNDLLGELGKMMGIPGLKLNEQNVCRVIFDKKLTVDFESSNDGKTIHIYSTLCSIPSNKAEKERLYNAVMEANLFGHGTGGSSFCADPSQNEVVFCRVLSAEKTDFTDFATVLEAFLNYFETWVNKLEEWTKEPLKEETTSSASASKEEDSEDPDLLFFNRV